MGKSAPDAPAAPDPQATAAAQTQANIDTARTQANLNRVSQYGPTGSRVFSPVPSGPWDEAGYLAANPDVAAEVERLRAQGQDYSGQQHYAKFGQYEGRSGVPTSYNPNAEDRWTETVTLSPEQQRLLDLNQQAQIRFGETANAQLEKLSGILSQPLDFSGLPGYSALPEYSDAAMTRQAAADALYGRINPQLSAQRDALDAKLRNQGLTPGSQAWETAMRESAMTQNDARLAVDAQASAEQQRTFQTENQMRQQTFAMDSQRRQQALQELLAQRQIPLNEISAMLGGAQVSYPEFGQAPQASQVNVAPTDFLGAVGQQQAGQNAAWQGQVATTQANNTAAAGAATAAITAAAIIA